MEIELNYVFKSLTRKIISFSNTVKTNDLYYEMLHMIPKIENN